MRKFWRDRGHHAGAPGLRADQRLDLVVEGDVGAAEAVDGLLRVADHEELAGLELHLPPRRGARLALAEVEDDLRLQRVGVLELVDEEVAEAPLKGAAGVEIGREQVAQAAEEVGEVESSEGDLGRRPPSGRRHRRRRRPVR